MKMCLKLGIKTNIEICSIKCTEEEDDQTRAFVSLSFSDDRTELTFFCRNSVFSAPPLGAWHLELQLEGALIMAICPFYSLFDST
jgi:hypothetical protein